MSNNKTNKTVSPVSEKQIIPIAEKFLQQEKLP